MADHEKPGTVLSFPGLGENVEAVFLSTEYPAAAAGHIVDMCLRQGLDREFVDIFRQHLSDLNLVISDGDDGGRSFIDVRRVSKAQDKESWKRIAVLSKNDMVARKAAIFAVTEAVELPTPVEAAVEAVVLDWVFYELAFDALNNACYMQHNYDKYIYDFDGQSPSYRAEYTISNEYLKSHPELSVNLDTDYVRSKAGFALLLMHDAVVEKGLFPQAKQADWLVRELTRYYMNGDRANSGPYGIEEISSRLQNMSPERNGRARMAEFVEYILSLSLDPEPS